MAPRGVFVGALAAACSLAIVGPAGAQSSTTTAVPRTAPVVRVPFPQDDGTLTPYTFELGYSLMTLVYDTLLWRDDEGVPQPWLAKVVESGPDPRRVTIRLDPAARWHDGRAVTAADVVFTFRFMRERPHPRFTPQLRAVERVDAPDAATVVVTLRHPSPGFRDQPLADVPILPAHVWQGLPRSERAPAGLPVGSGPYRLVEHSGAAGYRFEAVPGYFRGPPAVATIEVPVIGTFTDTVRALERREVDMVPVSLPASSAAGRRGPATRVREGPSYAGTVLAFNLRRAPFDRAEVRQAVARAVDVRGLTRAVGAATPADRGYLHPASPWVPAEPPDGSGSVGTVDLRPLALPPLEVLVAENDPMKVEAARHVVRNLRQAGAEATVTAVPYKALADAVGENGGEPSFTVAVWTTPTLASYEPDYLRAVFGSDAVLNYGGYRSAAFDAAADRVATTEDAGARKQAVADELRVLAQEVPAVPLFFPTSRFAYRPAVYDGWRFVKGIGLLDKRSFTDPAPSPAAARPPGPPARTGSSGLSPVGWAAVAVALAAVVIVAVGLLRGRR